jgi:hypothetical protein
MEKVEHIPEEQASRLIVIEVRGGVVQDDDVNATLYIRTTEDDPSGSPEWSEWRQFLVGDYTARAFEFQLRLTSGTNTHNMLVTGLSATVDMPDRVDSERNLTSGAGTYSVTFPSAFKETPTIVITPKNLATGDYYAVSNESETGFDLVFRNAAAAAVSRNFGSNLFSSWRDQTDEDREKLQQQYGHYRPVDEVHVELPPAQGLGIRHVSFAPAGASAPVMLPA